MGMYKIRRNLVVQGGSVDIGADCNLYRNAANVLRTGDAMTVDGALHAGGTVGLVGATRVNGALTLGSAVTFGSANFIMNEGSVTPTLTVHGDLQRYHTLGTTLMLAFRSNGTTYTMAFPSATHGTPTITVA